MPPLLTFLLMGGEVGASRVTRHLSRGPTGLLRGLLATVGFTSWAWPCFLLARGPVGPHGWRQGAWPSLPEPQVTRAKQACRWHGPRTLVSTGSGPFDPPPPPKNRV